MLSFLGEIECKVDAKGRITMPAKLLKLLPEEYRTQFVINRGIERCLTLYTIPEWGKVVKKMQPLNNFNPKNRRFLRQFFGGATDITLDGNNRLLLPKRLISYASLGKSVVLLGYFDKIEIWDSAAYDAMMEIDPEEYAILANEVMGAEDDEPIVEEVKTTATATKAKEEQTTITEEEE